MSEPVARISRIDIILWTLVAAFIVTNVVLPPLGVSTLALSVIFVFVSAAFLVLHGTLSYGWRGVLIFSALALVISNAMENLSIVTGFPFGHYHYSSTLGPKLFLVPILIGPAYVTVGYLAWTIAGILLNMRKPGDRALGIVALPVVASFVMVLWDLALDPSSSTYRQSWIWEDGGGYFGVPLSNFLGWYLTVYLFFHAFTIYLWKTGSVPNLGRGRKLQVAVAYLSLGLGYVARFAIAPNVVVVDQRGTPWNVHDLMETQAIIGLFVIGFVAIVAIVKVLTEGDAPIDRDVVETGHVMSSASSPDSSRQLRTLKEALRTRLAPDEWSAIFEREPEPRPRNRGANERLDGPPRV